MSIRNDNASSIALISQEEADAHIYRAIGLFIGQGRRYSVEDIETGTGIPARTASGWIANAIENRRRPKGSHLLVLQGFLGLEFTNKLLAPVGQGGRWLNPESSEPSVVVAKLAAGVAEFAARGADGRYCHVDRAELEDDADMIIATVLPFATRSRQ